jgi:iron complex transport system ATP-binding protein
VFLRAESLEVRIAGRTLVRGLNLVVRGGERWGVLGRNGAGKTTLLHVLAGLRPPDAGRVLLDDEPVERISRRLLARQVGVLLQEETRDYWGSAREYAMLGRYPHSGGMFGPDVTDHEVVDRALAVMDLEQIANRAYRSLSGGERQRARLAALFAQHPLCYLCDEPLQQLDRPHQGAMLDWISRESRQRHAASLMVLHDLVFASRYCDRLLLLFGDGRHMSGACRDMLTEQNLRGLYGFPVEAHQLDGETVFLPTRNRGDGQL